MGLAKAGDETQRLGYTYIHMYIHIRFLEEKKIKIKKFGGGSNHQVINRILVYFCFGLGGGDLMVETLGRLEAGDVRRASHRSSIVPRPPSLTNERIRIVKREVGRSSLAH